MGTRSMDARKMAGPSLRFPVRQRGMSLVGLVFSLVVLGMLVLLGFKILPTYLEYRAILSAIVSAKAAAGGPREIRSAFDRSAGATYITSISGKDLSIDKDGAEIEVSFAYEKKIPLVGPASLVLDYAGSTGARAARSAEPETK
jgi:type II secretory pathway pseudopilin PulG